MDISTFFKDRTILPEEGVWLIIIKVPVDINRTIAEQIDHIYKYSSMSDCNITMAKMYGFKDVESFIGVRLGDLLPPTPFNLEYLSNFISNHYKITDAVSKEIDLDGKPLYFSNSLEGIFNADEQLIGAAGIQRDITDTYRREI